jgi:hypothetical protein
MSVFGSSTPPAIKLPTTPGGRVAGTVVELLPERQANKYRTPAEVAANAPRIGDFWPARNGEAPRPKMQQGIVLQLGPGFAKLNSNDKGLRTLYVTEGDPRSRAFRDYNRANRVQPQVGMFLELEFVGTEVGQGPNPKQVWKVNRLEQAAAGGGIFDGDNEPFEDEPELATVGAPAVPAARPRARAAASPPQGNGAI